MRKLILCLLTVLATIHCWSQESSFKKYRYTYLWDVTLSMYGWTNDPGLRPVKNKDLGIDIRGYNKATDIYDVVRKNLMNDIKDNIWDETAEIVVIPFQDGICEVWREKATEDGKNAILNKINEYRNPKVTDTEIAKPLQYVIDNVLSSDRIDILKLMTDGPTQNPEPLYSLLDNWCKTAIAKDVYAFYIKLTSAAVDPHLKDIIQEQCRFYDEDGPVVEIISIRPYGQVSVNVNDTYPSGQFRVQCDVQPPQKKLNDLGVKLHFSTVDNPYIAIDADVSPDDNNFFQVPFNFCQNLDSLKENLSSGGKVMVNISLVGGDFNKENRIRLLNQRLFINLTARFENTVQISWED